MIDTMAGAHTYGDDDSTVLRALRRAVVGLAVVLVVIGLCLLAVGLALEDVRLWNLGCTILLMAVAGGGTVIVCLYIGERVLRGQARVLRRLDAVEAGERLIADVVRLDELRRRREG